MTTASWSWAAASAVGCSRSGVLTRPSVTIKRLLRRAVACCYVLLNVPLEEGQRGAGPAVRELPAGVDHQARGARAGDRGPAALRGGLPCGPACGRVELLATLRVGPPVPIGLGSSLLPRWCKLRSS